MDSVSLWEFHFEKNNPYQNTCSVSAHFLENSSTSYAPNRMNESSSSTCCAGPIDLNPVMLKGVIGLDMSSTFGDWWFGLVVWIPGIPENERDCYLGVSLESQESPIR